MPKLKEVQRRRAIKDPPPECGHIHPGGAPCAEVAGHPGDHEPAMLDDLNGSCRTATLVAEGKVGSTTDAEGWHRLCPVAIIDGRGVVIRCGCQCHDVVEICVRCAEVTDDLDPATLRCLDTDACTERFMQRLEANPKWRQYRDAHAKAVEAEKEAKADRPRPTKEGRCHHCGEPTRGGMFLAGHDMKLKGELIRASQAGDAEACAELMIRGWHRDIHSDAATELAADKIVQGTPSHVYLAARNEARWSQ